MTELKPCPFCGNNLNAQCPLDTIYPDNRELTLWQVTCNDCGVMMLGESKEDAIASWNARIQ